MPTALKKTRKVLPVCPENRVVLEGIDWTTYKKIGDLFLDRPIRMTYCDGVLEIMTLSSFHENLKKVLARLVELLFLELRIPARSFGSMTCSRVDLEKGMEPDECYWIANADKLQGRQDVDLDRDPPPDLALEMEVSRRLGQRWKIYLALKVPEVWSWDGGDVVFHVLKGGKYRVASRSKAFPFLGSKDLTGFARQMAEEDELGGLLAFQEWLREKRK